MDVRIGNLVRLLQAGPFDAATLRQAKVALLGLRGHRELPGMHGDLLVLLDDFAEGAQDRATSAGAYLLGADLCESAGMREQFVERLVLALHADPADARIPRRLRSVLSGTDEKKRLRSLLSVRADALAEQKDADPAVAAGAYVLLGGELAKAGDLDGAVTAHERALDLDATVPHVEALASLYARRRASGDLEQAADLYCLLSELSAPQQQRALLERALSLVPGHTEALGRRAALDGVTAVAWAPTTGETETETETETIAAAETETETETIAAAGIAAPTASLPPAVTIVTDASAEPDVPTLNATAPGAPLQATHVTSTPRPAAAPIGDDDIDSLRPAANLPLRSVLPRKPMQWVAAAGVAAALIGVVVYALSGSEDSVASSTPAAKPAAKAAAAARADKPTAARQTATHTAVAPRERPRSKRHAARKPTVQLRHGRARLRGAKVSRAKVLAAVGRNLPKLQRCYRSALRRKPKMQGSLVYTLDLQRNGKARHVEKASGNIRDRRLLACTGKVLQRTRFPRFKQGKVAKLRLPLRFQNGG